MRGIFSFILIFLSLSAFAENRIFLLQISNLKTLKSRTVYSSLDPLQYKNFYPLNRDEVIEYIDTWRCKGHTGYLRIPCAKP